ncbi:MAG: hypothetical protein KAS51_06200 [Candidatus Omnitrophica bacterium]|nr:hypothetical protein [Candidatus Omnitrophota bacterium]
MGRGFLLTFLLAMIISRKHYKIKGIGVYCLLGEKNNERFNSYYKKTKNE